jgi:MFS superfamily sulfate permease-like transporter
MVPLACLAAILLMVGYKLTKVELFVQLFRQGWTQFMPFIATILGILFTDLLKGIAIGMGVAIFYILRSNYRTPFYFKKEEHHEGETVTIELSQEVTFLNKASIMIMLEELPPNSAVTIDGSNSNMIDYDVKEIIENFIAHAPLRNIKLKVINVDGVDQAQVERRIRQSIDPDGIDRAPISST